MTKLAYLATITVLCAGIAVAQTPMQKGDSSNCGGGSAQSAQTSKPDQAKTGDTSAKLDCPSSDWAPPATSPSTMTTVPNTTIQEQPGTATNDAARPGSGTMGTSGGTPEMTTPQSTQPSASSSPEVTPQSSSGVPSQAPQSTRLSGKPPHSPDPGTRPNPQSNDPNTSPPKD